MIRAIARRTWAILGVGPLLGLALVLGCAAPSAPAAPPPAGQSSTSPPQGPAAASPATQARLADAPAAAGPAAANAPNARAPLSPPVRVTTGVIGAGSDAPIYIAQERGYFDEEGLAVEVIPFDTAGQMIAPMSAGQLDVGAGGITVGLFNAIGQGLPLRVVANKAYNPPGSDYVGWAVRRDLFAAGAIQTPADLRGRVLGMGSAPSIVDLELDMLLRRGGLSPADVELKPLAYADQPAAFANQSIDVAYQFEPTLTRLRDGGLADLWIRSADLVPNQQNSIIMYAADFGSSRRAAADRWMVAYLRGVRDYERAMRQTPRDGAVVAILTKNTSVKEADLWQRMTPNDVNPNGYVDRDVVQQDLDFFVQNGSVERAPDLAQVIDNSFVDYAVGVLGRQ